LVRQDVRRVEHVQPLVFHGTHVETVTVGRTNERTREVSKASKRNDMRDRVTDPSPQGGAIGFVTKGWNVPVDCDNVVQV
jgi:hypothetical protein